MMWMSSTMDENRQKGKWLVVECKTLNGLKWIVFPQKITLTISYGKWDDYDITFMITMTIKYERLKCIECINKEDELYDVFTCYMKFLKNDPSWH
jgi:hypothetical protein